MNPLRWLLTASVWQALRLCYNTARDHGGRLSPAA
nr:UDP-forming cellulose synthase catalytic subunit [Candidatus Pantoea persica]